MSYWTGLRGYFENDDGSLPELEISFHGSSASCLAFDRLNGKAKANVTVGGSSLWSKKENRAVPYQNGAAALVCSGEIDPFHIVLGGIEQDSIILPDLGVFFSNGSLTLDYRMGPEWSEQSVGALISLVREFCSIGGDFSAPWWRSDPGAEALFIAAIVNWDA